MAPTSCRSPLPTAWPGAIHKSVAISFIINNIAAPHLEFLPDNMESLFSKLQVTMGGTIVEDYTTNNNRLATLFTKYPSTDKIFEQSSMQLGAQEAMTETGANVLLAVAPPLFSV